MMKPQSQPMKTMATLAILVIRQKWRIWKSLPMILQILLMCSRTNSVSCRGRIPFNRSNSLIRHTFHSNQCGLVYRKLMIDCFSMTFFPQASMEKDGKVQ